MFILLLFWKHRLFYLLIFISFFVLFTATYFTFTAYISSNLTIESSSLKKITIDGAEVYLSTSITNNSVFDVDLKRIKIKLFDETNKQIRKRNITFSIDDMQEIERLPISIAKYKEQVVELNIQISETIKNVTGNIAFFICYGMFTCECTIMID